MIVALKELSIRGDFRTTVEYLIKSVSFQLYIKLYFKTFTNCRLISHHRLLERGFRDQYHYDCVA